MTARPAHPGDRIIDTNVLINASAAATAPGTPASIEDVPLDAGEQLVVLEWLEAFRADTARHIVLDEQMLLWTEYNNKLTAQHYGLLVVAELMQRRCRIAPIELDADGHGQLPADLEDVVHDRADRKLVALSLAADSTTIANASDTDWHDWKPALAARGITVEELVPAYVKRTRAAKGQEQADG